MFRIVVSFVTAILITACAPIPDQDVAKPKASPIAGRGTFMDDKLAIDVQAAITEIVGSHRVISSTTLQKTTMSSPNGVAGSREWSELWIFNPVSLSGTLEISIQERGPYITSFEIKTWDGNIQVFQSDNRE